MKLETLAAYDILNKLRVEGVQLVILDEVVATIESLLYDDPSEDYEYGYNNALNDIIEVIHKYTEEN